MKGKLAILAILFAVLVGVIAFTRSDKPIEVQGSDSALASASSSHVEEVNDLKISLNEARVEDLADEEDMQLVIIDLTVENTSNEVKEFALYKFTLVDSEGYAHPHASNVETKGILGGQLHPDRKNRGEIAFKVPVDTSYELIYTDHLRTGQVSWEITIDS
ncbi:DUF4352 domain-containing protein [Halalkalibacterium halodurans]|uniref:DUF4352 domain-containing protein n=1 Tax=Halalkalibacterium halodurans TaxID=86665 RepID=UPI00106780FA|nr:DUF4352 domain-containing protein [Halalkalibacterium halodurans]MED3647006.1 DUF4352 domain-containing protein [Halalkalibacterium halodurans]TES57573.1 DUF4352 domain-containing protein [Halalkalibacterium halodurans]